MKTLMLLLISISNFSYAEMGPQPSKTSGGRFQLIQLSSMRRDQYMIDTQTGKIWTRVCLHSVSNDDCALGAWTIDNVEGITATQEQLAKMQKAAKGE